SPRSGRPRQMQRAAISSPIGPFKFVLQARTLRKMPHLREILFCNAADVAAVHAGRRKSETVNSQIAGQTGF
ncbi:hypothetical protein VWY74_10895, partial [Phaeobacter sp. JH20_24]|uniref:hypothetical protein n=1 Tax=Phaeobacter sp. JH20_24 TaxID=3112481 RepID=UPI003A839CED